KFVLQRTCSRSWRLVQTALLPTLHLATFCSSFWNLPNWTNRPSYCRGRVRFLLIKPPSRQISPPQIPLGSPPSQLVQKTRLSQSENEKYYCSLCKEIPIRKLPAYTALLNRQ